MPVYAYRMITDMTESLRNIGRNFFAKTPLVLSPDEFVAAFIDPDHVPKLREVQELVGFVGASSLYTSIPTSLGFKIKANIAFAGSAPIILPQYSRHGLQASCPDDIRAKVTKWADDRYSYGTAFGDAVDAIVWLNDQCGDLRAMSVMLPCIASVMSGISDQEDSKTNKRARKLVEQTRFGKLPKLPGPVKQRLMEVSALVNATTLVKDAPFPTTKLHEAVVQFYELISAPVRVNIFWGEDPNTVVPTASFV